MRYLLIYLLIFIPFSIANAQQNAYLKNNEDGRLIKLKRKTILTFKTSDSTLVTGRILIIKDQLLEISTSRKKKESEIIPVQINSVQEITNKLMNKPPALAGITGYIGLIGLITSPLLLITDSKEDAQGLFEASLVFLGVSVVAYSPHLIQRKFDTEKKWTLFTQ